MSEIGCLVSRWRWLEADGEYQAETAETETESERLIAIHHDEQEEIERKLANLVPENFLDVCTHLEFATEMAERDLEAMLLSGG